MMVNSMERLIQNFRWRVLLFLNPRRAKSKETFGFKTLRIPPPLPETAEFENDLIDMIKGIEYKNVSNEFQDKLKAEKETIQNEPKLIVAADKT